MHCELPFGIYLIPLFLLFVSSFVLYKMTERFLIGIRSVKWPFVEEIIIKSEIRENPNPSSKKIRALFYPLIKYEYFINGTSYTGEIISAAMFPDGALKSAKRIVSKYSAGKKVKVFYSMRKPSLSVLEPGIQKEIFLILFFCIACIYCSDINVLLYRLHKKRVFS